MTDRSTEASIFESTTGSVSWHVDPLFAILAIIPGFTCALASFLSLGYMTGAIGKWNISLLVCAGACMGSGVWSTHFVATSSLVLESQSNGTFCFSPLPMVGSLLVPLIGFPFAFFALFYKEDVKPWQVLVAFPFGGMSIVVMHLVGQFAIQNYQNHFSWGWIAASIVSALIMAAAAIVLYSVFKHTWSDRWWKKVLCALLMDAGINTMHWLAVQGTTYSPRINPARTCSIPKTTAAQLSLVITVLIGVVLFVAVADWTNARRTTLKAPHQVMLALAYFSPEGNVLVSASSNALPSTKVVDKYHFASEGLLAESSVFAWFYRLSRRWSIIAGMIPDMHRDVSEEEARIVRENGTYNPRLEENPEFRFKERLCIAVHELSSTMNRAIEDIGVLYPGVLDTGTIFTRQRHPIFTMLTLRRAHISQEEEDAVAQGKMLFIVKKLTRTEANQFRNMGYRFAPTEFTIDRAAYSLHISKRAMESLLTRLWDYQTCCSSLDPGVYLAAFVLKASRGALPRVLVPRKTPDLIPTIRIQGVDRIKGFQQAILERMDKENACNVLASLERKVTHGKPIQEFHDALLAALYHMRSRIGGALFDDLQLFAELRTGPCNFTVSQSDSSKPVCLIVLGGILNVSNALYGENEDEFIPVSIFKHAQYALHSEDGDEYFAVKTVREFSMISRTRADVRTTRPGDADRRPAIPIPNVSRCLRSPIEVSNEPGNSSTEIIELSSMHAPGSAQLQQPKSEMDKIIECITEEHRRKSKARFGRLGGAFNILG